MRNRSGRTQVRRKIAPLLKALKKKKKQRVEGGTDDDFREKKTPCRKPAKTRNYLVLLVRTASAVRP